MPRTMNEQQTSRIQQRERQGQQLQQDDAKLARLAGEKNKDEFFQRITPLLGPLKQYIKRQLRAAYFSQQLRTELYTSGDILDQVILNAYENYDKKPAELTLEEWLYRLANNEVEKYIKKRASQEKRRKSLESMRQQEVRTLEEVERITADAEREPYLVEDLDDAELDEREPNPPSEGETPEQELEREQTALQLIASLSEQPEPDRTVFELSVIEGFSKEAVARITGVKADDVPRIANKVRERIAQALIEEKKQKAS